MIAARSILALSKSLFTVTRVVKSLGIIFSFFIKSPLAEVNGKDVRIAMNSKFIIDAVNALGGEKIVLSFNNQIQPFTCENADEVFGDNIFLLYKVTVVEVGR